jgi:O-antigen/teichoic acid export membrane protein
MNHLTFSPVERGLALLAGIFNLLVGLGFFFLPELHLPLWPPPKTIPDVLARFIGAIILGNGVGAIWLSTEREWARVRPLALVAVVYGTLVAGGLLYEILARNASSTFWLYFLFDMLFLIVYYALFIYHDIIPRLAKQSKQRVTTPQG